MEIGQHFGIRSSNGVNDLLIALERKGYIVRRKGTARGIQLPEQGPATPATNASMRRIPVVGEGDAANPLTLFMNPQGTLAPDPGLFPVANSFAAIVADDGMDGEGIFKGDYVIVEQKNDPGDGALVFALSGKQQVVRRLTGPTGGQTLIAVNRYYPPIDVSDGQASVAVLGEVRGVLRLLTSNTNAT